MLDNDIIMPAHSLKQMNKFLDEHLHFAAIALTKNRRFDGNDPVIIDSHIDMSCVLFRNEVLQSLAFRDTLSDQKLCCQCIFMCKDIRSLGYEIGFLNFFYAEHVSNTKLPLEPIS